MHNNYFRDDNNEDLCLYDSKDVYELEAQNFPFQCPFMRMYFDQFIPRSPQGPQGQPPSGPPSFTPQEAQAQQYGATTFVDQGAIRPCIFRFVYIWPRRGSGFWAWLTFVGSRSVAGFRWDGRRWNYFGMDLRDIRSFQCF
jgi:hypothetical protein